MTRSVLLICRANLCRSPTAEVMLRVGLVASSVDVAVYSCGLEAVPGQVAPQEFVDAALARGIDLRDREPIAFTRERALACDVVLTMTRDLLRTMVVDTPSLWPSSFTLLELVRRGVSLEPPEPGEGWEPWLARVHATRDRAELLGANATDDVRDPMADTSDGNPETFDQLEQATRKLARLLAVLSG